MAIYEEALRECGIDYYLVGGHAFYAQQEVYDLLNLLRALARPGDAASLAGVLRSPMFGLEDETLYWLSRHPEGLSGGLFSEGCHAHAGADMPNLRCAPGGHGTRLVLSQRQRDRSVLRQRRSPSCGR